MKIIYRQSFNRDLKKLRSNPILSLLKIVLNEIKKRESLVEISNLKKLTGNKGYYRVRIKNYRLGLYVENDTVEIVRFLHRKDVYKFFP
jgi:mRNA interferase RelE/StbE